MKKYEIPEAILLRLDNDLLTASEEQGDPPTTFCASCPTTPTYSDDQEHAEQCVNTAVTALQNKAGF